MKRLYLETERLIIRPLELSDDEGMFAMDSDAEVHKYVGQQPVTTIEQTRDVIKFVQDQYDTLGIGRWAVIEKGTNDFVGWTGLKLMKTTVNGHTDFYDFGYRLTRKHWGKGYGTESGRASLQYGLDVMGLKDIYAMTDVDNAASRRILEKLGFQFTGLFDYDAEPIWRTPGQPTTWYKWHG